MPAAKWIAILCLLWISFQGNSQDRQVTLFNNGIPDNWFVQEDVIAFTTQNKDVWPLAFQQEVVKHHLFRHDAPDKLNILVFNPEANAFERNRVLNEIKASPLFYAQFPVLTKFPERGAEDKLWYVTDDLVLVAFITDSCSASKVDAFSERHRLEVYSQPSPQMPVMPVSHYIFRISDSVLRFDNSILVASRILEQDNTWVKNARPNMIYEVPDEEDFDLDLYHDGVHTMIREPDKAPFTVEQEWGWLSLYIRPTGETRTLHLSIHDLSGRNLQNRSIHPDESLIAFPIDQFGEGLFFLSVRNHEGRPLFTFKFHHFR